MRACLNTCFPFLQEAPDSHLRQGPEHGVGLPVVQLHVRAGFPRLRQLQQRPELRQLGGRLPRHQEDCLAPQHLRRQWPWRHHHVRRQLQCCHHRAGAAEQAVSPRNGGYMTRGAGSLSRPTTNQSCYVSDVRSRRALGKPDIFPSSESCEWTEIFTVNSILKCFA